MVALGEGEASRDLRVPELFPGIVLADALPPLRVEEPRRLGRLDDLAAEAAREDPGLRFGGREYLDNVTFRGIGGGAVMVRVAAWLGERVKGGRVRLWSLGRQPGGDPGAGRSAAGVLPERWFGPELATERERLGIPAEQAFKTKVDLGWEMIRRAQAEGVPFEAVACDELYGRSGWLRAKLDGAGIVYLANVPADTRVYLVEPRLGIPERPPGRRGPQIRRRQIISATGPVEARVLAAGADAPWQRVRVRLVERGELADEFAA